MELINARTGKKERLGHLYVMMGKEATDVKSAKAGDIIVVPKLAETRTGDTISLTGEIAVDPLAAAGAAVPGRDRGRQQEGRGQARDVPCPRGGKRPVDPYPAQRGNAPDRRSLRWAIRKLTCCIARCKEQTGVEVRLVTVRIPYRETITQDRRGRRAVIRSRRAAPGSSETAGCASAPNPGAGYEFVDEIKGGAIPGGLIPAVDKGVQEAMTGRCARWLSRWLTSRCAVFDGSYHSVDSNEMAFKTAARIGFRAACDQADPVLLEPMADLEITVGEDYAGTGHGRHLHAPRPHRRHRLQ